MGFGRLAGSIFLFDIAIFLAVLSIFATLSNDTFSTYVQHANSTAGQNITLSVQDESLAVWNMADPTIPSADAPGAEIDGPLSGWSAGAHAPSQDNTTSPNEAYYTDIEKIAADIGEANESTSFYVDIEDITIEDGQPANGSIGPDLERPGLWDEELPANGSIGPDLEQSYPGDEELPANGSIGPDLEQLNLSDDVSNAVAKFTESVADGKKIISAGGVIISADLETYCLPDNFCDVPIEITYAGENDSISILIDEVQFSNPRALSSKPALYRGRAMRSQFELWHPLERKRGGSKNKEYDSITLGNGETRTIFIRANLSEDTEWSARFYTPEGWVELDPIINVSSCANLNTAGATYVLTRSISGQQGDGHCININANNIVLNCNGYSITSTSNDATNVGIYASGRLNATITSCTITGYGTNIYFSGTNSSQIISTNVYNAYGLVLMGTQYGGAGIALDNCNDISISSTTARRNTFNGVIASYSNNTYISNSRFLANGICGVAVEQSNYSFVEKSNFTLYTQSLPYPQTFYGKSAVCDSSSAYTTIHNSTINGHDEAGVNSLNSRYLIVNSTRFGPSMNNRSINLQGTNDSVIERSVFNYSSLEGFAVVLNASRNISIRHNALNASFIGISTTESSGIIISNNTFYAHASELHFYSYFGGNIIEHNSFNRNSAITDTGPAIELENKLDWALDTIRYNRISPPPNQPAYEPNYLSFVSISDANNISIYSNNITKTLIAFDLGDGTLGPDLKTYMVSINISNNRVFNTSIGINADYDIYSLVDSEVSGNVFDIQNTTGLELSSSSLVYSPLTLLYNLTFSNNTVLGISGGELCGGIIATAIPISIEKSHFINNTFEWLDCSAQPEYKYGYISPLRIVNSTISGNNARNATNFFSLRSTQRLDLYAVNISITNNTCNFVDNCIFFGGNKIVTLNNSVISGNNISYNIYGILSSPGIRANNVTISENVFANMSFGIFFDSVILNNLSIERNEFRDNIEYLDISPHAIYAYASGSQLRIYNNTITNTSAGITLIPQILNETEIYDNRIYGPFSGSVQIFDIGGICLIFSHNSQNFDSFRIYNNYIDGNCIGCAWGLSTYAPGNESVFSAVDIYNNTIKGMEGAVYVKNLDYMRFYNNTLVQAGQSYFGNILSSLIQNNTFDGSKKLFGTAFNYTNFSNNRFFSNSYGAEIEKIAYSNILSNQFDNVVEGIMLSEGNNVVIGNNSVNGSAGNCVLVEQFMAGTNTFANNTASNCDGYGIYVDNVTFANFNNTLIQNASLYGLYAINHLAGTGDYAITFHNTSIYNTSSPLYVHRADAYPRNPRFVGLEMGYSPAVGKLRMADFYVQRADANASSYLAAPDFVSLAVPSLENISANITLDAASCNKLKIYRKAGFPTSRQEILSSGSICSTCSILSCGGGTALFNITSFSGYALSSDMHSCAVINESGTYVARNNLLGAPNYVYLSELMVEANVCIEINASNVVFDCDGYSITNTGVPGVTGGILVDKGRSNVTVRNCSVSGYMYGITVYNASSTAIVENTAYNNTNGIYLLFNTFNITVANNTARNNSNANIFSQNFVSFISGSSFINNTAYGGTYGLYISDDNAINISGSTMHSNQYNLMLISALSNVTNNRLYNSSIVDFVFFPLTPSSTTMDNIIFDSPSGNYYGFTNLSITESTSFQFSVNWSSAPAAPPSGRVPFNDKYVRINGTSLYLDTVAFKWNEDELPGYNESTFELWAYNYSSGSWVLINNTPNISGNHISVSNLNFPAVYGLFSFTGSSCGVISSPGTYLLFNDVSGAPVPVLLPAVGAQVAVCIEVNASNVTLDCRGYSVKNNGTTAPGGTVGIFIDSGRTNVTVRNCSVSNYAYGIATYNVTNSLIHNNTMSNNSQHGGMLFYNSQYNRMENNTAYNNTAGGLAVHYLSTYNNVSGNVIYSSIQDGIYVGAFSSYNIFTNNTAYTTGRYGIYIDSSHNNVLRSNLIYYCTNNNIALGNANNNTIANSTIHSGQWFGISLSNSNYSTISNNTLFNYTNPSAGYVIYLTTNSNYNNITSNSVYDGRYGYVVVGSSSFNRLSYNNASNMTRDGYAIGYSAANNSLYYNNATGCSYYGYSVYEDAYNTTLDSNIGYSNYVSTYIRTRATLVSLYNNTFHTNQYYSLWISNATNIYVDRDRYYNSSGGEIRVVNGPLTYNLSQVVIDNPYGSSENFTVLSLDDNVGAGEHYLIKWASNSSTLPSQMRPFGQKFINISAVAGTPSIDTITWHWDDSETPGYNEQRFEIWKYNSSGWAMLNNSPDIATNTLRLSSVNPASEYGILENTESICMRITQPGKYTLRNSISGAPFSASPIWGGNVCIYIDSSDVELDCANYSISNNGTSNAAAVFAPYKDNVTVRNCVIDNSYLRGIYYRGSFDSAIINNTVRSVLEHAVMLDSEAYNVGVEDNIIHSVGGVGVLLEGYSRFNQIRNNTIYSAAAGIVPYTNSPQNVISNNTVHSCNGYGGIVTISGMTNITDNFVYGNKPYGIWLWGANSNNVSGNRIWNNSIGLLAESSNNSFVHGNTIHNNTNDGIHANYSTNNTFLNNVAENNTIYGIIIVLSANTTVDNATTKNNFVGIQVGGSSGTTVNNSIAEYNADSGARIIGGGNNTLENSILSHNSKNGLYIYLSVQNNITNVSAYMNGENGVALQESNHTRITGANASHNTNYGIAINVSSFNNISSSYTSRNSGVETSAGIAVAYGSKSNNIDMHTSFNDTISALLYDADFNTIRNSNLSQSIYTIFLAGQTNDYNEIANTTILTQYNGIYAEGGTNNNYTNNTITGPNNGNGVGIYLRNSGSNANISRNEITAFRNGIHIEGAGWSANTISLNDVHSNAQYCIVFGGANNIVGGNIVHGCEYGMYASGDGNALANNTVHSSTYGLYAGAPGNLFINDTHTFNNSYDFYAYSIQAGKAVYVRNLTIDSPQGSFANYTSLNITDLSDGNVAYYINWSPISDLTLPAFRRSFENKDVSIKIASGTPVLESISWHWSDAETGGYDEGRIELWKHNASGWAMLNNSPDTAANTLSLTDHVPASDYVLLEGVNCPLISEGGSYVMDKDHYGAPNDASPLGGLACVKIAASNVYLDCAGHSITDNGTSNSFGILINGSQSNITITNCSISGYDYNYVSYDSNQTGLLNSELRDSEINAYVYIGDGITLSGLTLNNSLSHSLFVMDANNVSIADNIVDYAVDGIGILAYLSSQVAIHNNTVDHAYGGIGAFFGVDSVNITSNRVYNTNSYGAVFTYYATNGLIWNNTGQNNFRGIYAEQSSGISFANNSFYDNAFCGTEVSGSANLSFEGNTFYGSLGDGFRFSNMSNSTASGNVIYDSQGRGFAIYNSHNNTIYNNTAYNCSLNCLALAQNSSNNTLLGNRLYNSLIALYLGNSHLNNITGNQVYNSSQDCVAAIYGSDSNTLSGNTIYNCGYHGIEISNFASRTTVLNNTIYDTAASGIDITNSWENNISLNNISNAHISILLDRTNYTIIEDNALYRNRVAGLLAISSYANSIRGNTISENPVGASIMNTFDTNLTGNTVHSSTIVGYNFENQNNTLVSEDHLYNNSVDIFVNSTFSGLIINLTNVSIDNPLGNYENYTRIYLSDTIDASTSYAINWSSQPAPLPSLRFSFMEKYTNVMPVSGATSIDYIAWHWLDSELVEYDESRFELWKHDGSSWAMLNNTPDTTNNVISLTDMNPESDYGILQNNETTCEVINESGNYALQNSVVGAPYTVSLPDVGMQVAVCIEINASDVEFDCAGYSITNNGTAASHGSVGVLIDAGRQNVTVKNCIVSNYTQGIAAYKASGNFIHNNTAYENSQFGILLFYQSAYNLVENNTAYNNSVAGLSSYVLSSYNNFTGNIVHNNSLYGIYLYTASNNNILSGNNIQDHTLNYGKGIYTDSIASATIATNTFQSNYEHIRLESSTHSIISDNNLSTSSSHAINNYRSNYTNISNNIVSGAVSGVGILFEQSHYSYAWNNTVNDSAGGIATYNLANNNTIENNTVYNCGAGVYGGYGIIYSQNNTFVNNIGYDNNPYGILLSGASSNHLMNNTIRNNVIGVNSIKSSMNFMINNSISYNNVIGVHFDSNSFSYELSDNYICFNDYMDINNTGTLNIGELDYCDYWHNWGENNHYGCEFSCSALWHRFFGNVSGRIYLTDNESGPDTYVYRWTNAERANVYFANSDSVISWQQLQAIGRNVSNETSTDDFVELDQAFLSTAFPDNINSTYSVDGTLPRQARAYTAYGRPISNVPAANSTLMGTVFQTGILWDMSDGGDEYDGTQSTVWVVEAKPSAEPDAYGVYEYLAMIPYTLATYEGHSNKTTIYMELT